MCQRREPEDGKALLELLRTDFIGLDTEYPLADGRKTRRHYLDSAASTLMMRSAHMLAQRFLEHYSNPHSELHFAARISTTAYEWAHTEVIRFLNGDSDRYTCFFTGSGSTGGFNRIARLLQAWRPEKDIALISQMEHHSNDLPHRKHMTEVIHIPLQGHTPDLGTVDLSALKEILEAHRGRVNYIAVTGASNVTGIINPIHEVAELAHAYDACVVVDASQLVAHAPIHLCDQEQPERDIDVLVFSGHKVYAPGSPGAVVLSRKLSGELKPDEVGGGMVDWVYLDRSLATRALPDRYEAGTPNVPGALMLATALRTLSQVGMEHVHEETSQLLRRTTAALSRMPGVRLYGCLDLERVPRTGIITFNLDGLDHGLVAAALNDYHNVAVRNQCFCAQPYVREMLKPELWALDVDVDDPAAVRAIKNRQGMVRASFGIYTTEADVEALLAGLSDLLSRPSHYRSLYRSDSGGNYYHRDFLVPTTDMFDPDTLLASWYRTPAKRGRSTWVHDRAR